MAAAGVGLNTELGMPITGFMECTYLSTVGTAAVGGMATLGAELFGSIRALGEGTVGVAVGVITAAGVGGLKHGQYEAL